MSISKIIKSIATPRLEKEGYSFDKLEGGCRWKFLCSHSNEITKEIIYKKSNYHNAMDVEFSVNNCGYMFYTTASDIKNTKNVLGWEYNSEQKLEYLISFLTDIVCSEGKEYLCKASTPLMVPDYCISENLFSNHEELCNKFIQKFSIDTCTIDRKTAYLASLKIDQIVDSIHDREFEKNKEDLLNIAAFIGETLINITKSKWVFELGRCYIKGAYSADVEPLFMVFNFWNIGLSEFSFNQLIRSIYVITKTETINWIN